MTTCKPTRLRSSVSVSSLMYAPPQSMPSWKFTSYLQPDHTKTVKQVLVTFILHGFVNFNRQITDLTYTPTNFSSSWTRLYFCKSELTVRLEVHPRRRRVCPSLLRSHGVWPGTWAPDPGLLELCSPSAAPQTTYLKPQTGEALTFNNLKFLLGSWLTLIWLVKIFWVCVCVCACVCAGPQSLTRL